MSLHSQVHATGDKVGQVKSLRNCWLFTAWKEKLEFQSCTLEAEYLKPGLLDGRESAHLLRATVPLLRNEEIAAPAHCHSEYLTRCGLFPLF